MTAWQTLDNSPDNYVMADFEATQYPQPKNLRKIQILPKADNTAAVQQTSPIQEGK